MKIRLQESYMGILLILIILVIFIPVPPAAFDVLMMLSLFLAILILLNALYSREPLEMSLFPTILLVTTMFRLVLNFILTRLVLTRGYAGQVIARFGEVVAGNNVAVGLILFAIIVIVNFMVITKGSERVAEVTARFTLDAMPGKQMAIDADLNAGLIDEAEAKARRKKISDESAFFGAMDGASKFVKGDAIASILITFINLIGGIVVGVMNMGMSAGDAFNTFSLLTIGGGLVGQVSALLISMATGLLVTKASSEAGLSQTISAQLLGNPLVFYITGGALVFLGITLLPWYFFVPFGVLIIFVGFNIGRKRAVASIQTEITADDAAVDEIRRVDSVVSFMGIDMINLFVGYGLIPLVESSQGGDLSDRIFMIRRQLALETGAVTPTIRVQDDIKLSPSEYEIRIKGVKVAGGDIMFDHYLAINPGYVEEEIEGIETVEPFSGMPALWISELQRERAEALGYSVVDPPAIIATHLTETIRAHLHELLTRQDVQTLINNVKETHPVLIDELVPKLLNIGDIQKVLSNLLRENVTIRDLVTILETLADYAQVTRDTDMLTEHVRQALKRSISKKFFTGGSNMVLTLDPGLEQTIIESVKQTEQGSYIALDPKTTQSIFDRLQGEIGKLTSMGLDPIILTSPIVRTYFKRLVEPIVPSLTVLSYNEIDTSVELQSVGLVSV